MEKTQKSQDGTAKQSIHSAQDITPQQAQSDDKVYVNGVAINRTPVGVSQDHPSIVAAPMVKEFASGEKTKEVNTASNTKTSDNNE